MAKKIELDLDNIVEMILQGDSYKTIAQKLNIGLTKLHEFTSNTNHSARVREALIISASTFDDKAEQVLLDAKRDMVEIQRARELAQHYRWKASKRAPRVYGDKLDLTTDGEKIQRTIVWGGKQIKI